MPSRVPADELSLAWDRCAAAGGASNQLFDCSTNAGAFRLCAALQSDTLIAGIIAAELVVDMQAESPDLPDWWLVSLQGCRPNALRPVVTVQPFSPCIDPWSGDATPLLQDQVLGSPRGLSSQSRLLIVVSVPSNSPATLSAGAVYQLLELQLFAFGTISPPAACTGCPVPVCLVLNSARLVRPAGGVADVMFAPVGASNLATWQSAGGPTCSAVPARSRTWGSIKSLYR